MVGRDEYRGAGLLLVCASFLASCGSGPESPLVRIRVTPKFALQRLTYTAASGPIEVQARLTVVELRLFGPLQFEPDGLFWNEDEVPIAVYTIVGHVDIEPTDCRVVGCIDLDPPPPEICPDHCRCVESTAPWFDRDEVVVDWTRPLRGEPGTLRAPPGVVTIRDVFVCDTPFARRLAPDEG